MPTPPRVHTWDALSSPLRAPPLSHTVVTHGAQKTTEPAGPSEVSLSQIPREGYEALSEDVFTFQPVER